MKASQPLWAPPVNRSGGWLTDECSTWRCWLVEVYAHLWLDWRISSVVGLLLLGYTLLLLRARR